MTGRTWLLLSWIVVGAAVLVVHAVLLWQVFRSEKLSWSWRLGALVPVVAPVAAWVEGKRASVIVWGLTVVLYVALRSLEGFV